MRGGADGLHLFPAIGDIQYYLHRRDIAIEAPSSDINSALDLGALSNGGYRGMNPNLEPLMEIWDAGQMMVAPSTALGFNNRSHFDAQRWIGNGAQDNSIDGYLNRYLQIASRTSDTFRGLVAGKTSPSTALIGDIVIPIVSNTDNYSIHESQNFCNGPGCLENNLLESMSEIASNGAGLTSIEKQIRDNQMLMVEALQVVEAAGKSYTSSANGREYSNSSIGSGLKTIAQLLKAETPIEVATLDWNIGWDTHSNQISNTSDRFSDQNFFYHKKMREGAEDMLTFFRDMGPMMRDIIVLVGSEFGREVKQNGARGTDHGHGGAFFAFGGNVTPGVGPDIKSLEEQELKDGRYVPMVTDVRDLIAEILVKHMYLPENLVSTVLPGHNFTDHGLFNGI